MSDFDPTPLLDELERTRARAEAAEERARELADAVHWLAVGSNVLTNDNFLPKVADSTLLKDGPVEQKDATLAAGLYSLRHGVMLAYAVLRDDATSGLKQVARAMAQDLDLHAPDLAKRSERELAKLAVYLHKRGAMELKP